MRKRTSTRRTNPQSRIHKNEKPHNKANNRFYNIKKEGVQRHLGTRTHGRVGCHGAVVKIRINSLRGTLGGWAFGHPFRVRLPPCKSWRQPAPSRWSSLSGTTTRSFRVFQQPGSVIRSPRISSRCRCGNRHRRSRRRHRRQQWEHLLSFGG